MIALHAGWQVAWLVEGLIVDDASPAWLPWLPIAVAAQALRYAAILSLRDAWSVRVIVVPDRARVVRGPYRLLDHPNYWGVALELFAVPMIVGAWRTAVVATLLNAWLLLRVRIPCEERALRVASPRAAS
jgi:methyltransferase